MKLVVFFATLFGIDPWNAVDYFHNSSSQREAASDLMKFISLKGDETVLDVGCGDGKITAAIARGLSNGSITGIDISPVMIDFAKEKFPDLLFVLKDAQQLDYEDEFDVLFSFTTLQWIERHDAFLKGAFRSLKASGILAITMPMGLPKLLQKAIDEVIAQPKWAPYFESFSTGWHFVEKEEYQQLLEKSGFSATRCVAVPQRDIFSSRASFEGFISQWLPYLRPLPDELKKPFLAQVMDRFLQWERFPEGEIHFKIRRLEVIAKKEGDFCPS